MSLSLSSNLFKVKRSGMKRHLKPWDFRVLIRRGLLIGLAFGGMSQLCAPESDSQEPESKAHRSGAIEIERIDTKVISWKPPLYHGWPTLSRRSNGELLLAFSGGREKHVCPSTVECDDGTMVTVWYEVLQDSPLGPIAPIALAFRCT